MIGEALITVRDDRENAEAWRLLLEVLRSLAERNGGENAEGIYGTALLRLVGKVDQLEGNAGQAGEWLKAVWRSAVSDYMRSRPGRGRRMTALGWDSDVSAEAVVHEPPPSPLAVEAVVDAVLAHVPEPSQPSARAAAMRLVFGADAEAICDATGAPTAASAYKRVERGRPLLIEAAYRWAGDDEWAIGVADALAEITRERRADHGRARPSRRTSRRRAA